MCEKLPASTGNGKPTNDSDFTVNVSGQMSGTYRGAAKALIVTVNTATMTYSVWDATQSPIMAFGAGATLAVAQLRYAGPQ